MAKSTKINYSEKDRAIVGALKNSENGLTLAEINKVTGLDIKSGSIVSAMKKGLIAKSDEVREVTRPAKRTVSTYSLVDTKPMLAANGKEYNYTDNEKAVMAAASTIDSPFTLAQLATAMNREKLSSGSINGLVKKGNIVKSGEVEVETQSKSKVGVYIFVNDIPADAEVAE